MSNYKVKFAPAGLMPSHQDWTICVRDDVTVLYLREDFHALPGDEMAEILEAAWTGYRALKSAVPPQRSVKLALH